MELLATLEIPQFPIKFPLSSKRRPIYYKKKDKLTKAIQKLVDDGTYVFNSSGILVDKLRKCYIAKNEKYLDVPREYVLSGNDFISGNPMIRAGLVKKLKEFYFPYVRTMQPFTKFPLIVSWDLYTELKTPVFDLSNLWFYYKYFEDTLTMDRDYNNKKIVPILPDDNYMYISRPGAPLLHPVDTHEQRKFVFKFYYDEREIWKKLNLIK